MLKYIEELSIGDAFAINDNVYILTSDFKNNGDKMSVDARAGNIRWFKSGESVEPVDLFLTSDGNFTPLRARPKNDTY